MQAEIEDKKHSRMEEEFEYDDEEEKLNK